MPLFADLLPEAEAGLRDSSSGQNKKLSLHRWVPWIAGFSADFVADCLRIYLPGRKPADTWVLDPFAGVGTTLVEASLQGRNVVGFEINPYAALAARTKLEAARISESKLSDHISAFERFSAHHCSNGHATSRPKTSPPQGFRGRTQLFSANVERKVLFALDYINAIEDRRIKDVFRLALGSVMVSFSNYSYEPSLTRRSAVGKADIADCDVGAVITAKLNSMLDDIVWLKSLSLQSSGRPHVDFFSASVFKAEEKLGRSGFVDIAVTSPPYLNNYHYPRNTRPQVHWLGLASGPGYAGARENESFGKFWQTVRDLPPIGLAFQLPELEARIKLIRKLNPDKGHYGGAGWANYVATYFNDAHKLCRILRGLLSPRGVAVIVLGNSIIQGVEIKTDFFIGKIAELCGLDFSETVLLRKKRTGTSIIQSSVRVDAAAEKVVLYESGIILRKRP